MARTRDRSPSPDPSPSPTSLLKKLKTSHSPSEHSVQNIPTPPQEPSAESLIIVEDPTPHFANDLFDHNNIARLNSDYAESGPFKYSIVEKLFQDDLLKKVKDECLSELNFTEKETDIYKVNPVTVLLFEMDINLSPAGQPDGRSCIAKFLISSPARSSPKPSHSARRPLFSPIPQVSSLSNGLWPSIR